MTTEPLRSSARQTEDRDEENVPLMSAATNVVTQFQVGARDLPVRKKIPFVNTRARLLDLARLCERWERMESAGVPIIETLKLLADNFASTSHPIATALDKVLCDVENGSLLAEAFPEHVKIFGENFVTCLAIGEETGTIDIQLGRLKKHFETEHKTNQNLKSLLLYPAILSSVAAFTIYVIVYKVVPQFAELMRSFDKFELPWPTRAVIWVSDVATSWVGLMIVLAAIVLAVMAVVTYKASADVRYSVQRYCLKIPIFGGLILYRNLASAFHAMGLILSATGKGPFSIRRAGAACPNVFIRDMFFQAAEGAMQGRAMCDVLIDTKIMPPEAEVMLRVAEKSGSYDDQLMKLSESFIGEVDYYRQTILEVIKPITIIFFGGICGIVVIAFYWPMFSMFQHIR
jgi:type IV pilus assembly protein PilC